MTEAQHTRAANYRPGHIVTFRRRRGHSAPRRNTGYRVEAVEAVEAGTVRLRPDKRARQRVESRLVDW